MSGVEHTDATLPSNGPLGSGQENFKRDSSWALVVWGKSQEVGQADAQRGPSTPALSKSP